MKHSKYISLFILLFLSHSPLKSQLISSRLLDSQTHEPIGYASVFISNTSIGTISDSSGFFQLRLAGLREVDLVISHLSYEIKSLRLSNPDEIMPLLYLQAKETRIDTVLISSDHSPKRKKWLRKFKRAFLGTSKNSKHTVILNPENILFQEKDKVLLATGIDYLKIRNEALGYMLRFYLHSFSLDRNGDVRYTGKVFFEDLGLEDMPTKRYQKARERAYSGSKRDFFTAIQRSNEERRKYEIGKTSFNDNLGISSYTKIDWSDLHISKGIKADTLYVDNFLSVINRSEKSFWYIFKGETKYPISFLSSESGKIIVSNNGNILNVKDVMEVGFWAKQRVADLLPLDYNPGASFIDISRNKVQALEQYIEKNSQEKVYLHLNKPYYVQGENIYLKAYLLNATNHKPGTDSKVIYTELIDPHGIIVDTLSFHLDKGTAGRFPLRKHKETGTYQIRAYTSYMRNFDPDYFFQQAFEVYSIERPNNIPSSVPQDDLSHQIQLEVPKSFSQTRSGPYKIHSLEKDTYLEIRIERDTSQNLEGAFLMGHVRGQVCILLEDLEAEDTLLVPLSRLSEGIVEITLFDSQGEFLAEHSYYHDVQAEKNPFRASINKPDQNPDQKLELEIALQDSSISLLSGSFSVSILDPALIRYSENSLNITDYLYLHSELGTSLSQLYLSGSLSKDSILQKQIIRRINLDKIDVPMDSLAFSRESGPGIQGFISRAGNPKDRIQAWVLLNSLGGDLFFDQIQTDKKGNFAFMNLPFRDSTLYILQSRIGKANENEGKIEIKGSRNLDIHLLPISRPEVQVYPSPPLANIEPQVWTDYLEKARIRDSLLGPIIELEEVEITGRRSVDPRVYDVFDLNRLEWVPPQTPALQLLSMFKAGNRYELDRYNNKMVLKKNYKGFERAFSVTFIIDNMLSSFLAFQALRADVIDYMAFSGSPSGSVIVVRTRTNGPRSLEKELEKGIQHYLHPGYDREQEFLDSQQELTETACFFWKPNLIFDDQNRASVLLDSDLGNRPLLIRIEGITDTGIPITQSIYLLP